MGSRNLSSLQLYASSIGVFCLQDTRCKPAAEQCFDRRHRSNLGDLVKRFYSVKLPFPYPSGDAPHRVGRSIPLWQIRSLLTTRPFNPTQLAWAFSDRLESRLQGNAAKVFSIPASPSRPFAP